MKNLKDRIRKAINRDRRDWYAFLLSLLVAFSIWLIHNLSLNYTDFIQVPVYAKCNLEGHSAVSINMSDVVARCRTSGYKILRSVVLGEKPVTVEFEPSSLHCKTEDVYYITSDELHEYAHVILGDNISVEYFISDTLYFRFPYEDHKKVPVFPVQILDFEPQYMAVGNLDVDPDSVTVYGEPYHLKNLDRVYTEPVKLYNLKSGKAGVAKIDKVKGVRLSDEQVHYSIEVSRFVEIKSIVPVKGRNVPLDKEMMIYPSSAEVTFRCVFPVISDVSDTPRFFVDYNDFISSRTGKCIIRVEDIPDGVLSCEIDPPAVECVVNEK